MTEFFRRPYPMATGASGFTMIELIVVVVIMGILAVAALPSMLNLQKDARISALNGLAGALQSAANMGRAKCSVTATCDMNSSACSGTFPHYTENGKQIYTHFGWPSGWGRCWLNDAVGSINDLVQVSAEFRLVAHVPGSFAAVYELVNSPNPTNCKVIYQLNSTQPSLATSVVSSGC